MLSFFIGMSRTIMNEGVLCAVEAQPWDFRLSDLHGDKPNRGHEEIGNQLWHCPAGLAWREGTQAHSAACRPAELRLGEAVGSKVNHALSLPGSKVGRAVVAPINSPARTAAQCSPRIETSEQVPSGSHLNI